MRHVRLFVYRWRYVFLIGIAVYALLLMRDSPPIATHYTAHKQIEESLKSRFTTPLNQPLKEQKRSINLDEVAVRFQGNGYDFTSVAIVGDANISLQQRMLAAVDKTAKPRMILSWNAGHSAENLGGCPDWNCEFSNDQKRVAEAGAILVASVDPNMPRRPDQFVVYFSQESPLNSWNHVGDPAYFNLSLGYRRDNPASSPYGYVVKLAPDSYNSEPLIDHVMVNGKQKAVAWFVSHCTTGSKRELYVDHLKKYIDVDVYGNCGPLKCPRGAECEKMLNTDYHFYLTFENSICEDYITEKLWNQGFSMDIVPVVLKRAIAEPFTPPHSFIAVDDFETVKDFADYLTYLMGNKTAYMEYFLWRRNYRVIFLNGREHDILERPWGFCQLCRILWQEPRPQHVIKDFHQWWDESCEFGELVDRILKRSVNTPSLGKAGDLRVRLPS